MELGATWALGLRPLPIIVPPITFAEVTRTIGLKQGWNITDADGLESIRQTVLEALGIEGRNNHTFNRKRVSWEANLKTALETLSPSTKVTASKYEQALRERDIYHRHYDEKVEELHAAKRRLITLKNLRPVALIADSDRLEAARLKADLEEMGFVVGGIVATERDAISTALRLKPDLIFLETRFPDGGLGTAAALRITEIIDVGVVFVTQTPEVLLGGQRPEPASLVTKPYNLAALTAVTRDAYSRVIESRERKT
jgi:hypothetical protein